MSDRSRAHSCVSSSYGRRVQLTAGAQHCLNNLLQGSVYSEFDLADLARK